MIDLKVSKIPAKDLMSSKSKCVKNNIKFDSIEIGLDSLDRTYVKFYSQEVLLASTIVDGQISSFSTMQIVIKDESDPGFRERIEVAITEIQEAPNEERIL